MCDTVYNGIHTAEIVSNIRLTGFTGILSKFHVMISVILILTSRNDRMHDELIDNINIKVSRFR